MTRRSLLLVLLFRLLTYFVQKRRTPPTFTVRSGQLFDPDTSVARMIASSPAIRIPLADIRVRTLTVHVVPTLVLAALNGALVAIVHDNSPSSPLSLTYPDRTGPRQFMLDCTGEIPAAATCLGFGIVRAIDLAENCLYLSTPVDKRLLHSYRQSLSLVLSQLSLPQQFCYFPGAPSHAYFSSEVTGEGAATIRARGNTIKRKNTQR